MKKIIVAIFAFTFCMSASSFADFKQAAELYEQQQFDEAYDEFLAAYKANDLRGNAYLKVLITKLKKDPDFWIEEEKEKLNDTTGKRSQNCLTASNCYIEFLKEKNQKKKKNIINQLLDLHKDFTSRATLILVTLAKDSTLKKVFKFQEPLEYYQYALKSTDRDVYISALEEGFLEQKVNEKEKLYANLLKRFPDGQGEFTISKMNKDNISIQNEWRISGAFLGNDDALKAFFDCLISEPEVGTFKVITMNSIGVSFLRVAHELKDNGIYALLVSDLYRKGLLLQKDLKNSLYWTKKAKDAGNYKGLFLCLEFEYNRIFEKNFSEDMTILLNYFKEIFNHPLSFESPEFNEKISMMITKFLVSIDIKNADQSFLPLLDYVIKFGSEDNKNRVLYVKAHMIIQKQIEGTDNDILKFLKESSKTTYNALYDLGLIYYWGKYSQSVNYEKTFEIMNKCSEISKAEGKNDFRCFFNLGVYYTLGIGCEKDNAKAFQFYNEAYSYKKNDCGLIYNFVYFCAELDESYKKIAYDLLIDANKRNLPYSDFYLAKYQLLGIGCEQDFESSIPVIKKYYDQKDRNAALLYAIYELIESPIVSFEKIEEYKNNADSWPLTDKDQYDYSNGEYEFFKLLYEKRLIELQNSSINPAIEVHDSQKTDEDLTSNSSESSLSTSDESSDQEVFYREENKFSKDVKDQEAAELEITESENDADIRKEIDKAKLLTLNKKRSFRIKKTRSIESKDSFDKVTSRKVKLSKKDQKTFDSIMDPSVGKNVKWAAFKKLVSSLVTDKNDYFAPSGKGFKMSLGGKTIGMHMPEHRESAVLCPGRLEDAHALLSGVAANIVSNE